MRPIDADKIKDAITENMGDWILDDVEFQQIMYVIGRMPVLSQGMRLENMTDEEFELSWPDYAEMHGLPVDDEGYKNAWWDEHVAISERVKARKIIRALDAIKAAGYRCRLMCSDNAHIQAISKHGKKMSYYAGTGTITGYLNTPLEGIDDFIDLLGRI